MSLEPIAFGDQPEEITGLTDGSSYEGQNVSPFPISVSQRPDGEVVTRASPQFVYPPYWGVVLEPVAGETLWVWASQGTGKINYND